MAWLHAVTPPSKQNKQSHHLSHCTRLTCHWGKRRRTARLLVSASTCPALVLRAQRARPPRNLLTLLQRPLFSHLSCSSMINTGGGLSSESNSAVLYCLHATLCYCRTSLTLGCKHLMYFGIKTSPSVRAYLFPITNIKQPCIF